MKLRRALRSNSRYHGRRLEIGTARYVGLWVLAFIISFAAMPSYLTHGTKRGTTFVHSAPLSSSFRGKVAAHGSTGTAPGVVPEALFSAPLRRLELNDAQLVGAGYDLVDVRILTAKGEPVTSTFMLDSGLSTNLVTESLFRELELIAEDVKQEGSALGGVESDLKITNLLGLQLLGSASRDESRFEGVWEGDGWRALCSVDWNGFVEKARGAGGKVADGFVEWTVLPTPDMTDEQISGLVGVKGTELVGGDMDDAGASFVGKGVSVEPKGFLATTKRYELQQEGNELLVTTEAVDKMRLRPAPARSALLLPGPLSAVCVPFAQEEVARRQGVVLGGMLGQLPLHRTVALDIDPIELKFAVHRASSAAMVAEAAGLLRLPGQDLSSGLFGVSLAHAPLLHRDGVPAPTEFVPALVDSGSANTIFNWPAAEKLLGIRQNDQIVKDSPRIRVVGVGGGSVDMPLITLSIGLLADQASQDGGQKMIRPKPIRVAIGDANIFEDIVGREEKGSWIGGLGPRALKPAALIGQDVLSQGRYLLSASEPAMYMSQGPALSTSTLEFVGVGDCIDAGGRRLQGLQKIATTPDEAAAACLEVGGSCHGIAVTPLTERRYQGLCYIFIDEGDEAAAALEERGWRRYEAPAGQSLAPAGALVVSANGDQGAECYALRPAA